MLNIKSECNIQCPQRQSESVAFMAQLSADLRNPANGRVVVFNNVITNVGNAYNSIHGIFTAPVNGTYNFNFAGSSPPGPSNNNSFHLYIMKNSARAGFVLFDHHTASWLHSTTDITLHLTEKDEVWMEVADSWGDLNILSGANMFTHFSGFLIHAD